MCHVIPLTRSNRHPPPLTEIQLSSLWLLHRSEKELVHGHPVFIKFAWWQD